MRKHVDKKVKCKLHFKSSVDFIKLASIVRSNCKDNGLWFAILRESELGYQYDACGHKGGPVLLICPAGVSGK